MLVCNCGVIAWGITFFIIRDVDVDAGFNTSTLELLIIIIV